MEKRMYYRCEPTTNGAYCVKEKLLYNAGMNYFETKDEAVAHFARAKKVALEKYEKIMEGIRKLDEEVGGFSYVCNATALDDAGVDTALYLEFTIDNYRFRFRQ